MKYSQNCVKGAVSRIVVKFHLIFGKTGDKNVQPLLQHCYNMSGKAVMHVLPPNVQTCQQPDFLQNRFDVGGKTRNIAIQLILQRCC